MKKSSGYRLQKSKIGRQFLFTAKKTLKDLKERAIMQSNPPRPATEPEHKQQANEMLQNVLIEAQGYRFRK